MSRISRSGERPGAWAEVSLAAGAPPGVVVPATVGRGRPVPDSGAF